MQQHYGCTLQRLQVNRSNLCGRAVRLVSLGQSGPMPTHLGGGRQGRCTIDCLESADHLERPRILYILDCLESADHLERLRKL